MRDNKHKTVVDSGRMAWWSQKADEAFWHKYFAEEIESSHQVIAEGIIPNYLNGVLKVLPREGKLLEAGCGTGWIVSAFKSKGYDIEGVDSSSDLIAEVLKRYPHLPVKIDDVLHLDVADNTYAAYLSFGVIEHRFDGCAPFLQEAFRVLKPGGIGVFSVPHFNALRSLKARLHVYADQPPEGSEFYQYAFTKSYLREQLITAGFEISHFYTSGTQYCVPEELGNSFRRLLKVRGMWRLRLPRLVPHFDRFDFTGLACHMIYAIVQKPSI